MRRDLTKMPGIFHDFTSSMSLQFQSAQLSLGQRVTLCLNSKCQAGHVSASSCMVREYVHNEDTPVRINLGGKVTLTRTQTNILNS